MNRLNKIVGHCSLLCNDDVRAHHVKATDYDEEDNAAFFAKIKKNYNWIFQPFHATMLSQVSLFCTNFVKSNKTAFR